jgi:hypothetical protein
MLRSLVAIIGAFATPLAAAQSNANLRPVYED